MVIVTLQVCMHGDISWYYFSKANRQTEGPDSSCACTLDCTISCRRIKGRWILSTRAPSKYTCNIKLKVYLSHLILWPSHLHCKCYCGGGIVGGNNHFWQSYFFPIHTTVLDIRQWMCPTTSGWICEGQAEALNATLKRSNGNESSTKEPKLKQARYKSTSC